MNHLDAPGGATAVTRRGLLALGAAALVSPMAVLAQAPGPQMPGPPLPAPAIEVAGVRFDHTIQLGGKPAVLNGAGVRYKAVFKVYAAGLYLAGRASTPEDVIAMPGPKRIHLVLLRTMDANEFGKIMSAGIEKNATRDEFVRSLPGIIRMGEAAAQHKELHAGDTMTVEWVPEVGATLYVKGRAEVGPLKDVAFFNAMAKIWLGMKPADAALKEAMLGAQRRQFGGN
jgi:hypothetical protein